MQPNLAYLSVEPPIWLSIAFVLTTALTLAGFLWTIHQSQPKRTIRVLGLSLFWLAVLGLGAANGFFKTVNGMPPRLSLSIAPPLLLIFGLLAAPAGRRFLDTLPLAPITYLNSIRILVELVLYGLYKYHQIPELMTFEGRNVDILAGLTAPLVAYFSFNKSVIPKRWLLLWNVGALFLLLNIVIHALLSTPSPIQQLAFQQPNVGILKFPYIWLPGFIVPVVLLGHLVSIRQLTTARN